MPRNYKLGTSPRKNRGCPYPGCEDRPRSGMKRMTHHFATKHGIPDYKAWSDVQWERYFSGVPSAYDQKYRK